MTNELWKCPLCHKPMSSTSGPGMEASEFRCINKNCYLTWNRFENIEIIIRER